MKKILSISGLLLFIIVCITVILLFIPNDFSEEFFRQAKARGYLSYTPAEATTLAYERCTTCHGADKIVKYCSRCGPPFVVTIHFMRKYVEIANTQGKDIPPFSDAEIVAIAQVWNGLVGNWEGDWPRKDIRKLLGNDRALIRLFETPVNERPIEVVLQEKVAPGSYKEITQKSKQKGL